MAKQELSTSIRFGGTIDPSWRGSVSNLNKGLQLVGRESDKLTARQKKLRKEIQEGKSAGRDVSGLVREYSRLGDEIKKAEHAQNQLNSSIRRTARLDKMRGLASGFGSKSLGLAKSAVMWGGAGLLAGAAGVAASPLILNQETAEEAGVAKSYGVKYSTYKAWNEGAGLAGMTGADFGNAIKKLSDKVGLLKASGGKQDQLSVPLTALKFKAHDFDGLDSEGQLAKILDRAASMKNVQMGNSMADAILGKGGSKIVSYMRDTGQSYEDLMTSMKKLSLVTDEGAAGAVRGNTAVGDFWTTIKSAAAEIAGQLGGELAPNIEQMTANVGDWLRNGGMEKIKGVILDDVIPAGIAFGKALWLIGETVYALAKKLEWLLPDEKEDHLTKQSLINQVAAGNSSLSLTESMAGDLGLDDWYKEKLSDPAVVRSLREQWKISHQNGGGGDAVEQKKLFDIVDPESASLLSRANELAKSFKNSSSSLASSSESGDSPGSQTPVADAVGSSTMTYRPTLSTVNHNKLEIYQLPGEDGEQLAGRVTDKMADFSSFDNSMYDKSGGWSG